MIQMRTALVFVMGLATGPLFAQSLGKDHERWIERDVAAIVTRDEAQLFHRLPSDADRDTFQQIFWLRRDPNLKTPENEFRAEYEERVAVADERIQARVGPGSLTDMGQIFILFGFPSSTSRSRGGTASVPDSGPALVEGSTSEVAPPRGVGTTAARLETWTYQPDPAIGLPNGLEVQFRAQPNFGYRLLKSEELDEALERRRQSLVAHASIGYELDPSGRLLPPAVPSEPTMATDLLDALLASKEPSDGVDFQITPMFFRSREGETYMPVLFELDASNLEKTDEGELDVTFFGAVTDADGDVAQRFEERVWMNASDDVRFEMPLQLAPGNYTAHVGVLDESRGAHGSRVGVVQVPAFDGDEMQMSSVILYRSAQQTDEAGGVPGRAFQFSKVKLEPIGSDAFTKADSLGLFFYVYGAEGQDVTARYVFYQGAAEKAQTRPQPLIATEGIALGSDEIPLASFAPGDYRVVIHVEDQESGNNLESSARFTLEP